MSINFDLEAGKTLKLLTAGKYCDRDIVVNAIGGGGSVSDVPIEWLEYLEGTGTQYVALDFKPNQDTRVVLDVEFTPTAGNTFLFGARTGAATQTFCLANYTNKLYRMHYYNGATDVASSSSVSGRFTVDMNKNVLTIADSFTLERTYAAFQCQYDMWLFDANTKNANTGRASMKLYSGLVYDNGTLVRDLRPCRLANALGLYDVLNDTFYYNCGTGDFVAGPVLTA